METQRERERERGGISWRVRNRRWGFCIEIWSVIHSLKPNLYRTCDNRRKFMIRTTFVKKWRLSFSDSISVFGVFFFVLLAHIKHSLYLVHLLQLSSAFSIIPWYTFTLSIFFFLFRRVHITRLHATLYSHSFCTIKKRKEKKRKEKRWENKM